MRNLILITDGGDNASLPEAAAEDAGRQGITIFTVGLGDPDGVHIPDPKHPGQYITYKGTEVRSGLNEDILRKIAGATPHGRYIPARTGSMDLGSLYSQLRQRIENEEDETAKAMIWQEWYQAILLPAIILLIIEALIGDRRRLSG